MAGTYWYDDTGFRVRKIARTLKGTEYQNVETLYPCKLYGLELADQIYPINNICLGLRVAAVAWKGLALGSARVLLRGHTLQWPNADFGDDHVARILGPTQKE